MPWGDELVTLDESDSIRSALAKLENSVGGPPVVVLSSRCRIAENELTYRLLARMSERYGVPLAVVTGNPAWRHLAREQGLRSFPSLGSFRRARGRSPLSSVEEMADSLLSTLHPSSVLETWPVLLAVTLILGAAAFFLLPVMRVTLRVPAETLSRDVTVKVDVGTATADGSAMIIPGRTVEHRFSVSDFTATTGERQIGKERARGEVTIINSRPQLVPIPAGTVLIAASGAKFTTDALVTVGPFLSSGQTSTPSGPVPGAGGVTVKIPVVAVEPGEKGNVPALAISRIEGEAFRTLTVVNEEALTGGTDVKARTVSADDRAKLKEIIFQKVQSQSLAELTVRVGPSESLIASSMQVQVESEQYDRAQDEEGAQLKGTFYVLASAMAYANKDLSTVVEGDWKRSAPRGYRPLPGNLTLSTPDAREAGSRTATLSVKVTGRVEPMVETSSLTELLRGSSPSDARVKLGGLDGGLRLQGVEIWPQWAPRAYRIEVQTIQ